MVPESWQTRSDWPPIGDWHDARHDGRLDSSFADFIEKIIENVVVKKHLCGHEITASFCFQPQRGDVVLLRGRFGVPLRVTGGTNAEITAGLEILDQITGMAEVPGVGGRGIGGDVSAQSQNVFNSRLPECL